jgi:LPS O-antigen subunit length determinant protein (WzzB/FepE family)
MAMETNQKDIDLVELWEIIWKRKWRIIIPTALAVVAAAVFALLKPPVWEVDAILLPSKFFMQTAQGQFIEVVVTEPKQIAGQINQESYNNLIAAELKIDIKDFPKIRAENLSDTQLVRVLIRDEEAKQAKAILSSLFNHLKRELDRKIEVEMKSIDTQITTKLNNIKDMENEIQFKEFDIKSLEIEKERIKGEIEANKNRLIISEERSNSLLEEMKSVKGRIDDLDSQLKKVLAEEKGGAEAVSLLLYSNEVQQNLRYYGTLDEKISLERLTQENLRLDNKDNDEKIKQYDTKIGQTKSEIANIKNKISTTQSEIKLLEDEKQRIDYAQLVKAPTASVYPVSPRLSIIVVIVAAIGLAVFTFLAFLWEYIQKRKAKQG